MDHHPGLGDLLQPGLPLEHDQGTMSVRRQQPSSGCHDLCHAFAGALLGRREQPGERAHPADPLEGPPELRLEDHHEREQADHGTGLHDLGQQPQAERLGRSVYGEQDGHADDEPDGAGPADEAEEPIDEEGGDPDIDQGGRFDLTQDRINELPHRRPSLASVLLGSARAACRRPLRASPQAHRATRRGSSAKRSPIRRHSRSRAAASPVSSISRPSSSSFSAAGPRQPRSRYSSANVT